jgi:hypothetical protein
MRIGSWNLHGRWSDEHPKFLERQDCNVWLLAEVRTDVHLVGSHQVVTKALMTQDRHWSAILSRPGLEERDDPHPSIAAAVVEGTTARSTT